MGDLKTFWTNPVYPDTSDLGGQLPVSSGSDPNAAGGDGPGGIQTFWDQKALPENEEPGTKETANSVSGLPPLPNRFEPAQGTVPIPTLQDRIPGTIDEQ